MTHIVYVHHDAHGAPLYVGSTARLRQRTYEHRSKSAWASQIASVVVDSTHADRLAAVARETELIAALRPPYNLRIDRPVDRGGTAAAVGGVVEAEIERRGLSRADVAASLSLSLSAFSRRLRGEKPFNFDELGTLAGHFGVPVAQFIAPLDTQAAS